ncbi:helix-turn-helix transcriptional regulator [Arthrobacter sp. NEB 688]|uniref:PadR family transcriptional regulator n=1 Tax=Arthrobacter sp. NEB 688 TaxID=904039 RepID=UPI00156369E7|nr:helix-turn-helix transcriptional regulator [Arthrobacter sp. NEB 688]QKE85249.1 PadR family transcriptional regulator [Arthrobacter sp. NEB 688]
MTGPTRAVLEVFVEDPDVARYGLEIGSHAGLASGTVHPILARLEGAGWLESGWEDVDPAGVGRPRRRFYRLTASGVREAAAALASAQARRARLRGRMAGRPALGGTS